MRRDAGKVAARAQKNAQTDPLSSSDGCAGLPALVVPVSAGAARPREETDRRHRC